MEGYGRRKYKADFVWFLIYSLSSNDETIDNLEILCETDSLKDESTSRHIHEKLELLEKKLNNFLQAVQRSHNEFQN